MNVLLGLIGATLLGGVAGVLGALWLTHQRLKRLKQRLIHPLRQEAMDAAQQASESYLALQKSIDRLHQNHEQLQQELSAIKRQVARLQLRSSALKTPSSSPSPGLTTSEVATVSETAAEGTPVELGQDSVERVIAWLGTRQVSVESYYQLSSDADFIFDDLAVYLGDRYTALASLYKQMKRDVSSGRQFRFSLKDKSQEDINLCTQFCQKLSGLSLLSSYRYSKSEKLIQATLQSRADVIRFFHGQWFERFVCRKVTQLLAQRRLDYECLMNPKVVFQNGDRFELDLLFLVNNEPLWIECKTGKNYDAFLERYSNHQKVLGIPKSHSLFVILDVPETQVAARNRFWQLTVTSQDSFLQAVEAFLATLEPQKTQGGSPTPSPSPARRIKEDATPSDPPEELPAPPTPEAKLLAILNKTDLNPVAEHRATILHHLIQIFAREYQPLSFKQLKEVLAEQTQVSKSKVQSILKAIYRSHYFLNQSGQSIASYNEPIYALLSNDPFHLEQQCIEQYIITILRTDSSYFDNPQNERCFEQTVGISLSSAAIDRLKAQSHAIDLHPDRSLLLEDEAEA